MLPWKRCRKEKMFDMSLEDLERVCVCMRVLTGEVVYSRLAYIYLWDIYVKDITLQVMSKAHS